MIGDWFNGREAAEFGSSLAQRVALSGGLGAADAHGAPRGGDPAKTLQQLLRKDTGKVQSIGQNVYKRAKLASSFKWKLLDSGVGRELADHLTQALIMQVAWSRNEAKPGGSGGAAAAKPNDGIAVKALFTHAGRQFERGEILESIGSYEKLLQIDAENAEAHNNLGVACLKLRRHREAETHYRNAVALKPGMPDAHCNLGIVLRLSGALEEAERELRRTLQLQPNHVLARQNLAGVALDLGRVRDAAAGFKKVLKAAPNNADALVGMGAVASMNGELAEAEAWFRRALRANPSMPAAWAALAHLRKMTAADEAWMNRAQALCRDGISAHEEALLRFAVGKYFDDVGDYGSAFRSYQRGNALLRETCARGYDRKEHTQLVNQTIRAYPHPLQAAGGVGSDSKMPVFVVGMVRSGTSLAEQIIATHPAARGAGELGFWSTAAAKHSDAIANGTLPASVIKQLSEDYLKLISDRSDQAIRVVDKATVNSDCLGLIHAVFPNARFIHMKRNPIDTCVSAYFQNFSGNLEYTRDLSDLAFYYRNHHRLMAHWRKVLPPGSILEVSYEDLIADQQLWTRKMLDFIGLDWDPRCLNFHENKRAVATASFRQVREPVYTASVQRWRHYEKFIGPLLSLEDLSH